MEANNRNGSYNHCLGSECPTSCCNFKKIRIDDGTPIAVDHTKRSLHNGLELPYTIKANQHEYRTSVQQGEVGKIRAQNPELKIDTVNCVVGVGDHDVKTELAMTISDCLGTFGCKLGTSKPTMCKTFPFPTAPTDIETNAKNCPAIYEIFADDENMRNILTLRKGLGLKNNREYVMFIHGVLRNAGKGIDWVFINDENFIDTIID